MGNTLKRVTVRAVSIVISVVICLDPTTVSAVQLLNNPSTIRALNPNFQAAFEQEALQAGLVQAYETVKSVAVQVRRIESPHILAQNEPAMRWSGQGLTSAQHALVNQAVEEHFPTGSPANVKDGWMVDWSNTEEQLLDPAGDLRRLGVRVFFLEGLSQRLLELGLETATDLVTDLVAHPGRTRGHIYLDASMRKILPTLGKEWLAAWAKHEIAHIQNPTADETSIQEIAPLPRIIPTEKTTTTQEEKESLPGQQADQWFDLLSEWIGKNTKDNEVPPALVLEGTYKDYQAILDRLRLPLRGFSSAVLEPVWEPEIGYVIHVTGEGMANPLRRYLLANVEGQWMRPITEGRFGSVQGTIGHLLEGLGPVELNRLDKEYSTYWGGTGKVRQMELAELPSTGYRIRVTFPATVKSEKVRVQIDGPTLATAVRRVTIEDAQTKDPLLVVDVDMSNAAVPKITTILQVARSKPSADHHEWQDYQQRRAEIRKKEGEQFKAWREALQVSPARMAERLDIGDSGKVGEYERGLIHIPSYIMEAVRVMAEHGSIDVETPSLQQKVPRAARQPAAVKVSRSKGISIVTRYRNSSGQPQGYKARSAQLEEGQLLRDLRRQLGLSQDEFAKEKFGFKGNARATGVTISKYERGSRRIPRKFWEKILALQTEVAPPVPAPVVPSVLPWDQTGLDWVERVVILLQSMADPNPTVADLATRLVRDRVFANDRWSQSVRGQVFRYLRHLAEENDVLPEVKDIGDLQRALEGIQDFSKGDIHVGSDYALDFVDALSSGWLQLFQQGPVPSAPAPVALIPRAPPALVSVAKQVSVQIRLTEERLARKMFTQAQRAYVAEDFETAYNLLILVDQRIDKLLENGAEKNLLDFQEQVEGRIQDVQDDLEPIIRDQFDGTLSRYSEIALTEKAKEGTLGQEVAQTLQGFTKLTSHSEFQKWAENIAWKAALEKLPTTVSSSASTPAEEKTTSPVPQGFGVYLIRNSWVDMKILFDNGDRTHLHPDVAEEFEKFFAARAIGGDALRPFSQSAPMETFYVLRVTKHPHRRVFFRVLENESGPAVVIIAADLKSKLSGNGALGYNKWFVRYLKPFNKSSGSYMRQRAERLQGITLSSEGKLLGTQTALWERIDRGMARFGQSPLSLETKVRHAFWVEQIPYLLLSAVNVLVSGLIAFSTISLSQALQLDLISSTAGLMGLLLLNVGFGSGHTERYTWRDGEVISLGPTSLSDRFGFMRKGATWQVGLVAASVFVALSHVLFPGGGLTPFLLGLTLMVSGHAVAMWKHFENNLSDGLLAMAGRSTKRNESRPLVQINTTSSYQTYVAADSLFDVLALGRWTMGGISIPKMGPTASGNESPDFDLMHETIEEAVRRKIPGAADLKAALTRGDVILLKASQLTSPMVLETADENLDTEKFLGYTPDGAVVQLLWLQRLLIEFRNIKKSEPAWWQRVLDTVSKSKNQEVRTLLDLSIELHKEFGLKDDPDAPMVFGIANGVSMHRDELEATAILGKILGRELAAPLKPLVSGTRPTTNEIRESRITAASVISTANEEAIESAWQDALAAARKKLDIASNEPAMRWSGQGLTNEQHDVVNKAVQEHFPSGSPLNVINGWLLDWSDSSSHVFDPSGELQKRGIRVFFLKGLNQRILELGVNASADLVTDLVTHPGRSRGHLYLDASLFELLPTLGTDWLTAWSKHEAAHIDNPDADEAAVQSLSPLPERRISAQTEVSSSELEQTDGSTEIDPLAPEQASEWLTSIRDWVGSETPESTAPSPILIKGKDAVNTGMVLDELGIWLGKFQEVILVPAYDPEKGYTIEVLGDSSMKDSRRLYLFALTNGQRLKPLPPKYKNKTQGSLGQLLDGYGPVNLLGIETDFATYAGGSSNVKQLEIAEMPNTGKRLRVSLPVTVKPKRVSVEIDGASFTTPLKRFWLSDAETKQLLVEVIVDTSESGKAKLQINAVVARGTGIGSRKRQPLQSPEERKKRAEQIRNWRNRLGLKPEALGRLLYPHWSVLVPTATRIYDLESGRIHVGDKVLRQVRDLVEAQFPGSTASDLQIPEPVGGVEVRSNSANQGAKPKDRVLWKARAETLEKMRKDLGITMLNMAYRLGLSGNTGTLKQTIFDWEHGNVFISDETMAKIENLSDRTTMPERAAALATLRTDLDIFAVEMGRRLGFSGSKALLGTKVRQWETGKVRIPDAVWARIEGLRQSLRNMEQDGGTLSQTSKPKRPSGKRGAQPEPAYWASLPAVPSQTVPGVYSSRLQKRVSKLTIGKLVKEANAKAGGMRDGQTVTLTAELGPGDYKVVSSPQMTILLPMNLIDQSPRWEQAARLAMTWGLSNETWRPDRFPTPIPVVMASAIVANTERGEPKDFFGGNCVRDGAIFVHESLDAELSNLQDNDAETVARALLLLHELRHEVTQKVGPEAEESFMALDRVAGLGFVKNVKGGFKTLRALATSPVTASLFEKIEVAPIEDAGLSPEPVTFFLNEQQFGEKYPQLIKLLSAEFIHEHWDDLHRLDVAAEHRTEFLFGVGFIKLIEAFGAEWVKAHWEGVVILGITAKEKAGAVLGIGLPSLRNDVRLILINIWWKEWVAMGSAAGERSWRLFSEGVPTLRRAMGPLWFAQNITDVVRLVQKDPVNCVDLFREEIPAKREVILSAGLDFYVEHHAISRSARSRLRPEAVSLLVQKLGADWVYERLTQIETIADRTPAFDDSKDRIGLAFLTDAYGAPWVHQHWDQLNQIASEAERYTPGVFRSLASMGQAPNTEQLRQHGTTFAAFLRRGLISPEEASNELPAAIDALARAYGIPWLNTNLALILTESARMGPNCTAFLQYSLPAVAHFMTPEKMSKFVETILAVGRRDQKDFRDLLVFYLPAVHRILNGRNTNHVVSQLMTIAGRARYPTTHNVAKTLNFFSAQLTEDNLLPYAEVFMHVGRANSMSTDDVAARWDPVLAVLTGTTLLNELTELRGLEPEIAAQVVTSALPKIAGRGLSIGKYIALAKRMASVVITSADIEEAEKLSEILGFSWVEQNADLLKSLRGPAWPGQQRPAFSQGLEKLESRLGQSWVQTHADELLEFAKQNSDLNLSKLVQSLDDFEKLLPGIIVPLLRSAPADQTLNLEPSLRVLKLLCPPLTGQDYRATLGQMITGLTLTGPEWNLQKIDSALMSRGRRIVPSARPRLELIRDLLPSLGSARTNVMVELIETLPDENKRALVRGVASDVGAWLGHSANEGNREGIDALRRLLEILRPADFERGRWLRIHKAMLRLRNSTTDYNRNFVYQLIFSKRHLDWISTDWLSKGEADIAHHLAFYADIMERYPRLGLQLLDGIVQALYQKQLTPRLTDAEQQQVFEFVSMMNNFSPELFTLYQEKGREALEDLFTFAPKVLADKVGQDEIASIIRRHTTSKSDGYGTVAAAIQMVIPTSGASFVKRDQISGVLRKFADLGDRRNDIPEALRDKDFGGGDGDAIDLTEWTLMPGSTFDPNGQVAALLDALRFRDALLEPSEATLRKKQDGERLHTALLSYLKDRTEKSSEAVRQAFYNFASHDDRLGEKIDRVKLGSYEGVNLAQQLFVDKENLYQLLKEEVDNLLSEHPELRPQVALEKNQPIRNPKALVQQILGIWRSSGENINVARGKFEGLLRDTDLNALQSGVIPALPEELRDLVFEIAANATTMRLLTTPELLTELLEPPAVVIENERLKFEPRGTGRRISLEFRVVKGIPYGLWGLSAGVCIATDLELWQKPEFMLLAMIDKESQQVVGFVHLFSVKQNGKRILTLPGIEPSVEFVSTVKPRDIYPLIEQAVIRVAKAGQFDSVVLPTSPNILSNRTGITSEAQKRGYRRVILSTKVAWNTLPSPYPFDDVYEIWHSGIDSQAVDHISQGLNDGFTFALRFMPITMGITVLISLIANYFHLSYGGGLTLTLIGGMTTFFSEQQWLRHFLKKIVFRSTNRQRQLSRVSA